MPSGPDHDSESARRLTDDELDAAFLAGLGNPAEQAPRPAEQAPRPTAASGGTRVGSYTLGAEVGRGGIGTVYRARDAVLGRDVAIKFLQDRHAGDDAHRARFVEEAQISGQLQHPGVMPIYELGESNGIPFFSMKLIQGRDLATILADRAGPSAEQHRFMTIFEQVCQTVAYAHARGVVHRDIKPANVMIGEFGEVQVVDWGLGKVLSEHGERAESRQQAVATVRSEDGGSRSVAGSMLGTPAYMPPEQALGDLERVDARSDVFSLGATLAELLTGAPAYVGTKEEVIEAAARGDVAAVYARLDASGAAPPLVALAKECLSPAIAERPHSARVLAARVEEFLGAAERRAQEARIAAAEERVRTAEVRRRQKLAVALVFVLLSGLATTLWFWRDAGVNLAKFNDLAHASLLRTAQSKAAELFPAWPENADELQGWLDGRARPLLRAQPELRETLDGLRAKALPRSPQEEERERREHPRFAEIARLRGELAWNERVRALRAGETELEPFELDEQRLPHLTHEISKLAWGWVMPNRKHFGREREALAMVRAAIARNNDEWLDSAHNTLAWALIANGGAHADVLRASDKAIRVTEPRNVPVWRGAKDRVEAALPNATAEAAAKRIVEVRAEIAALEKTLAERRSFEFAREPDRFLHDTLARLVADIASFESTVVASVQRRLRWAESIAGASITKHEKRWREARAAIAAADGETAHESYGPAKIDLAPQIGLVPIGMNPRTRLWEFYHLASAARRDDPAVIAIPAHAADGKIAVGDDTGIVFVLVPGGRFRMGAQGHDPAGDNFDENAQVDEGPPHGVTLRPFFVARHELSQGQWARLSEGEYPSWYKLGAMYNGIRGDVTEHHPLENVSWEETHALLGRHGLLIPTEAQWEYACRAGTATPWFSGANVRSLQGYVNIADRFSKRFFPEWQVDPISDGHGGPNKVGSYEPNAFGLHDMLGNVEEWTRDLHDQYYLVARDGDGLRAARQLIGFHVVRGGCFSDRAFEARVSRRSAWPFGTRGAGVGVRVARRVR